MYSFPRFKALDNEEQIEELSLRGIALDLAYDIDNTEAVLLAYNDFYVELVVEKISDEIISLRCFKGVRKFDEVKNVFHSGNFRRQSFNTGMNK